VFGISLIAAAIRWRNPFVGIFLTPIAVELIVIAALLMMGAVR
jgi:hypothetical protein